MFLSVYFFIFLILALFSMLSISKEGVKYTKFYMLFSFVILVFFAGLRAGSPDQATYALFFNESRSLFDLVEHGSNYGALGMQWGFLFLLSIIKTLTSNQTVMFLLLAFINVGMIFYACKKISPYPMLSILLYYSWFYYANLGALRHAMLSGMVMLTIVFVVNSKKFKSLLSYLYTIAVHKVGIFVLSVYFVKKLKLREYSYSGILFVSILIAFSGGVAYLMIEWLYLFLPGSWQDKIDAHIALGRFSGKENVLRGTTIKQLAILTVSILYFHSLHKRYSEKFNIIFGTYFFSTVYLLLFLDFKIIGDRVSNFLSITEIILIPMLLSIVTTRERFFVFSLIVGVMLFQVYRLYGNQFYLYEIIL